nr:PAS domain-containing protein [Caulobacter sp. 17J65-9]
MTATGTAVGDAALELQSRRLSDLIEGLGDAFYAMGRDWRITLWNAAAARFLELPREQALGAVVWDVFPDLAHGAFADSLRRCMASGQPEALQAASAVRPGRWLDWRVFATPTGIGVCFRDITDSKEAEIALRESERFRRLAMAAADIGAWELAPQSGALVWDERCQALWGLPARTDHQAWLNSLHPEDRDRAQAAVGAALDPKGDGAYAIEYRVIDARDGTERWLSVNGKALFAGGRATRFIGTAIDVTAQRRTSEELRSSEARLRLAMEVADIGAWDWDPATGTLVADARAKALFGLKPQDKPDFDQWRASVHPVDHARVEAAVGNAMTPGGDGRFEAEYRARGQDGVERWIAARGKALFDADQPVRFIGTAVDVTVRKRAEARREVLVNELNHRVKNSLATVQAIAWQTLGKQTDDAAARDALSARLAALARAHDVLTRHDWEGADLGEVVRQALAPFAAGDPGRFHISGPALRLTPKAALAISMALYELGANAARFGALSIPAGAIEVNWRIEGEQLELNWRESGGPPVKPPTHRGFGSRLIEQGLAGELGARTVLAFDQAGVTCAVFAPLAGVQAGDPKAHDL